MKNLYRRLLEWLDIVQISRVRDDFNDVYNTLRREHELTLVILASTIDAVSKINPSVGNDLKVQWGSLLTQTFTDANEPIIQKKDLN